MSSTPELLSLDALRELGIDYTSTHLRRLEDRDLFPRRVRLSRRTVMWVRSEVVRWVEHRIGLRDFAVRNVAPCR